MAGHSNRWKDKSQAYFDTAAGGINWQAVQADFLACQSWETVAAAQGVTVEKLASDFHALVDRPAADLVAWGQRLIAADKIAYLRSLSVLASQGSSRAAVKLEQARGPQNTQIDPLALLPDCCGAPSLFRGGWSVEEVKTLLAGACHCASDMAENCRKKSILAEKIAIRQVQSTKALEGDTKILEYLGQTELKQGIETSDSFKPTTWNFIEKEHNQ